MNRIFPEQLTVQLQNQLAPLYYLTGADPLLLSESQDNIVQTARTQGFDEKQEIVVDAQTNWSDLFEQVQSLGLFFNRQVMVLKLPETLLVPMQKNLAELINLLNEDVLLILHLPKFSKTMEKQAWHLAALKRFSPIPCVNCQTPTAEQLPRWLGNRAKAMNLKIATEGIQLLCYSYENNLLALKQTLELLSLLHKDGNLTLPRIKQVVEQSSIFTPYQWIDALFEGKLARAERILQGLKGEDVQPIILLRTLQRELLTLLDLAKPQTSAPQANQPLPLEQLRANFDRLKIWQNRRPFYTAVFKRFTYGKLYQLIQQLAKLERQAKSEFSNDLWIKLSIITLNFCH